MLDRLAGKKYYFFLDGYSRHYQIKIAPKDQHKTIFSYPYGTFAFHHMPFGLCNTLGIFQRCMMEIFLIKKMQRDMTHAELGEVSLHGNRENCSWAQDHPYGIRGGSYKD